MHICKYLLYTLYKEGLSRNFNSLHFRLNLVPTAELGLNTTFLYVIIIEQKMENYTHF